MTTLISTATDGTQGNGFSERPNLSPDGRYVAYNSYARNLVSGDTNNSSDIFVTDTQTGTTTRVSTASNGTNANSISVDPSLSSDGRYVAYSSLASDLVSGDRNGTADVFVTDTLTGITTLLSTASNGARSDGISIGPSISPDGRYVAYYGLATTLVGGDTNAAYDIFLTDTQTGATTRVSTATGGTQGNGDSLYPSISSGGRYVAYMSAATTLVGGDTNAAYDIFVTDTQTGATTRVSTATGGAEGNGASYTPSLSADGRYVAYYSEATNLVGGDTNAAYDIFVTDTQTNNTARVSIATGGTQGNGHSMYPSISSDGRYVAYTSGATNLVNGDTNGRNDIFVTDTQTGATIRVSTASDGTQGNDSSTDPSLSADGSMVAYYSSASNLVSGDTNGYPDIFLSPVDFAVPVLSSATVNGTSLVLTYADGAYLDATNAPAASAFNVAVDSAPVTVSSVAVNGGARTVTLTLAGAVTDGQAVTVGYSDPTTGNDANAIQDIYGNDAASLTNQTVTNNTDTTAPVFTGAVVSGTSLVLSYSDTANLDATNSPAASAFSVSAGGTPVTVNSVAVNAAAKTVTLTLASAVSYGQAVTVSYTDPTAGDDASAIQDASGNDAASLTNQTVTNSTGDTTAPVFTSAAVSGTSLVLSYTDAANLDATNIPAASAFSVSAGGAAVTVSSVAVNAAAKTVTLTLASAVSYGQAVTVGYSDPTAGDDAGAIQDVSGNDAASISSQTVTNNTADTTAPVFASAAVSGTSLVLSYSDAANLDATNIPATTAFSVSAGGAPVTVSSVAVNAAAKTVTLTLANAVSYGQAVTVSYTDPTAGDDASAIQDASGNDAASLTNQAVTNSTGDTTAPVFTSAAVNGASLVLSYSDAADLDVTNIPAASAFTVSAGGAPVTVSSVAVNAAAKTVTLTLANAVSYGQAVTVSYTDPTAGDDAGAIQDISGNDAASISSQTVTNNTADTAAPMFASAAVNGTTLVLSYTDAANLDATNIPAASAFSVSAGGAPVTVSSVAVNAAAKTVTLTLASAVSYGQTVTVGYSDPTAGDDVSAIQDIPGNDAASVSGQAVTNNTAAPSTGGGDSGTSTSPPTTTTTTTTTTNTTASTSLGGGITGSLPAGVSATNSSGTGDTSSASSTLSSAITQSSLGGSDKESAGNALQTYIASLPPGTTVTTSTVTLTGGGGTPQTIAINGTSATEAMVIDVSQLPPGTILVLENVEFAVIIGAAHITGGSGSNYVIGDGGSQYIVLGPEDDTLMGGAGADTIGSASGRDSLMGGDDGDVVFGGEDGDYLYGNAGADAVYGNSGSDQLYGGQGNDWLFGGQDGDTLRGDKGVDVLYGDKGGDVLYGNTGDDWLLGGDGADVLFGGQGNDWLAGEAGDDWLAGDMGADTLGGGAGADRFYLASPNLGADIITDFTSGSDAIVVKSPNFGSLPVGTLDGRYFALSGAETADSRFVFNSATGALSYDADGAGALAGTAIATLAGGLTLSARDVIVVS